MQPITANVLPHELLLRIMHFVPLNHRLAACACVSTAWRKAAEQATTAIAGQVRSMKALRALEAGLPSISRHVTRIDLEIPNPRADCFTVPKLTWSELQQLPFPRLQELVLSGFDWLHFRSGNYAGVLNEATGLTRLCLRGASRWRSSTPTGSGGLPAALLSLTLLQVGGAGCNWLCAFTRMLGFSACSIYVLCCRW